MISIHAEYSSNQLVIKRGEKGYLGEGYKKTNGVQSSRHPPFAQIYAKTSAKILFLFVSAKVSADIYLKPYVLREYLKIINNMKSF